jgi:hypothetical protein
LEPFETRTAKEKRTTSSQGILKEDVLLYLHFTRAVLRKPTPGNTSTADIWEKFRTPVQHQLSQQEIQRTVLSVQALKDTLKVVTVVQEIMTDLGEAVPKINTKWHLN